MRSIEHWGAVVALYSINKVRACTFYAFTCLLGTCFIGVIRHRVTQEFAYFLQTYKRKEIAWVLVTVTHNRLTRASFSFARILSSVRKCMVCTKHMSYFVGNGRRLYGACCRIGFLVLFISRINRC